MTPAPPPPEGTEELSLVAELKAKAHQSTRHKTVHRTPARTQDHVCWRAAAELSRLSISVRHNRELVVTLTETAGKNFERAEAAEAEVARLKGEVEHNGESSVMLLNEVERLHKLRAAEHARAEAAEARATALEGALGEIRDLKQDGPSRVGPLWDAGLQAGLSVARKIAEAALSSVATISRHPTPPNPVNSAHKPLRHKARPHGGEGGG